MKLPDHFIKEKDNGLRIIRRDTISRAEVISIIKNAGNNRGSRKKKVLKKGPKSSIYLFLAIIGGKKTYLCIKHYKSQGKVNALKGFFNPSRAVNSLKAAETLRGLKIKTATPLAVIEKRKCFLLEESFLIMENISSHLGVPEYIEQNFSHPLSKNQVERKRAFIKEFAHFLIDVHDQGTYQHDFKTTNIFVEENSAKKIFFWLIDLDHVRFKKRVSTGMKIINLVQINTSIPSAITITDRLRFFHYYTGEKKMQKKNKMIIRKIIRLSWKRNPHWHPRFGMDAKKIREWQ